MSEAVGRKPLPSRITRNPWLLLTFSSLVWGGNVVAGADAALGNVLDVSEIARMISVVKNLDWFSFEDIPREKK